MNRINWTRNCIINRQFSIYQNQNSQKFLFQLHQSYQCFIQIDRLNRNQERMFKTKQALTKAIVLALITMVLHAEIIAPARFQKFNLPDGHSNQITVKQTTTHTQSYPEIAAHSHEGIIWDGPSEQVDLRMNFRFDRTLKHFRVENVYQLEEEEQEPEVQTLTTVNKRINVVTKTSTVPQITTPLIKTTSLSEQPEENSKLVTAKPEQDREEERKINNVVLTTTKQVEQSRQAKAKRSEGSEDKGQGLTWGKDNLKEKLGEEKEQKKPEKAEEKQQESYLFISANPIEQSTLTTNAFAVKTNEGEVNWLTAKHDQNKEEKKEKGKNEAKREKEQDMVKDEKVSSTSEGSTSSTPALEWISKQNSKINWPDSQPSEKKESIENSKKESEGWTWKKEEKNEEQKSNLFKEVHQHKNEVKEEEKTDKEDQKHEAEKKESEQPVIPAPSDSIISVPSQNAPIQITPVPTSILENLPQTTSIPTESNSSETVSSNSSASNETVSIASSAEASTASTILPVSEVPIPAISLESTQPPSLISNLISSGSSLLQSTQLTSNSTETIPISTNSTSTSPVDTTTPPLPQSVVSIAPSAEISTASSADTLTLVSSIEASTSTSIPLTQTSISSVPLAVISSETSTPSIPLSSGLPESVTSTTITSNINQTPTVNLGGDSVSQLNVQYGGDIGSVSPSTPDPSIFSEDWTR